MLKDVAAIKNFQKKLLHWFKYTNERPLPWKSQTDCYPIWLSEIILQQTRVAQGLPYYLKFIKKYPTLQHLAAADSDEVFHLWQGLGYYNRCRNMMETAKYLVAEKNGEFPKTYEQLLLLKGVGNYTAAAIASFAYQLPVAVVDGNVYRVLSRYFADPHPIDAAGGKKYYQLLAQAVLVESDSACYNQAIMDLGALVCTPKKPNCADCPLNDNCLANQGGTPTLFPIKKKKAPLRKRFFHFFMLSKNNKIWMQKRDGTEIWPQLHQPFLIETEGLVTQSKIKNLLPACLHSHPLERIKSEQQKLTHQHLHLYFYRIDLNEKLTFTDLNTGKWYSHSELQKLAMPKQIHSFYAEMKYL